MGLKNVDDHKTPTPPNNSTAIIIGSLMISISILISGGGLKLSGLSEFKQGVSASSAPQAAAAAPAADNPSYDAAKEKDKLISLAADVGLNKDQFKTCLEADRHKTEISKDLADAQAVDANGTPTFFIGKSSADDMINGTRLVGAQPYSAFKTIIDAQLAQVAAGAPEASPSADSAKVALEGRPVLGDKNAPLTMVEFSDYECPFCKRYFQETYPQLKKDYIDTGKMKLVFRNLPLSFHEPAATAEASAALCSKELGGDKIYFQFHDVLFENTKSNGSGVV